MLEAPDTKVEAKAEVKDVVPKTEVSVQVKATNDDIAKASLNLTETKEIQKDTTDPKTSSQVVAPVSEEISAEEQKQLDELKAKIQLAKDDRDLK